MTQKQILETIQLKQSLKAQLKAVDDQIKSECIQRLKDWKQSERTIECANGQSVLFEKFSRVTVKYKDIAFALNSESKVTTFVDEHPECINKSTIYKTSIVKEKVEA